MRWVTVLLRQCADRTNCRLTSLGSNRWGLGTGQCLPLLPFHERNIITICRGGVEYTDQFRDWWDTLSEEQQVDLAATVELLMERGPTLPYPYSSGIVTSRHSHMRELRTQSGGEPLRTFYAFDPRRVSILLIGGIKTGNDRFYEEYVPIADQLYDDHLEEVRQEGSI